MSFTCLDIDECGTNTDNCHVDANCTNTKGSFYCTCHTGYSGDGVLCEGKIILQFMKKANSRMGHSNWSDAELANIAFLCLVTKLQVAPFAI